MALNNLFPVLIEYFGVPRIYALLSETLPILTSNKAVKGIIRALERTHLWSFEDSFRLVHEHEFSDEIRSLVVHK